MTIKDQWERQQKDSLDKLINWAGGVPELKNLLKLPTTANIHSWIKTGRVPGRYAIKIEKLTGGLISKYDLRPDKWQR